MTRRFWTNDEDAYLRETYGRVPVARIAFRRNRTVKAIYQRAVTLGLIQPRRYLGRDRHLLAFVRARHVDGWLDPEIAKEWTRQHPDRPLQRRSVVDLRKQLGLGSNRDGERYRDQVRQRTRQQLAAAGLSSVAELRSEAYRRFVRERGWPDYLRPRHAQLLDALYDRGPQTRAQLVAAMGLKDRGQRHWLSCKYGRGSYIADLMAAGFVVRSAYREVRGASKGKSVHRYVIAPGIVRRDPETWPDKELALGQIYGKAAGNDPRAAGATTTTARGADVPGKAAGRGGRQRGGKRRGGDRRRDRRAGKEGRPTRD